MFEVESGTVSSGTEPSIMKALSLLAVKIVMTETHIRHEVRHTHEKHKRPFPPKKLQGTNEPFTTQIEHTSLSISFFYSFCLQSKKV